jgi:hypothetical protein
VGSIPDEVIGFFNRPKLNLFFKICILLSSGQLCEHGNEPSDFLKCLEIVDIQLVLRI